MKIAIPIKDKKISVHFGHSSNFLFIDINPQTKDIVNQYYKEAPPHEPGILPGWINDNGATVILTGGIGHKAKELLNSYGIEVISGVVNLEPELIVEDFLSGHLKTSENYCNH